MTSGRPPEQIEREIERTREELGETVEALAAKTDVKAAARRKLGTARGKAPLAGGLLAIGALAGGLVLLRSRARRHHAARRRGAVQRASAIYARLRSRLTAGT